MASKQGKGVLAALSWRYATKKFDPERKVSDEDLEVLMESLRLAPSSMGVQPWKFLLVRDLETRKKLSGACFGQKQVQDASHLIVACAQKELTPAHLSKYFDSVSEANPEKSAAGKLAQAARLAGYRKMVEGYILSMGKEKTLAWNREQSYIALGFLLSACAHLGIDACPIEGYNKGAAAKVLGLDALGLELVTIVPIGYRAADDSHAREKKVRFGKGEVFSEI